MELVLPLTQDTLDVGYPFEVPVMGREGGGGEEDGEEGEKEGKKGRGKEKKGEGQKERRAREREKGRGPGRK